MLPLTELGHGRQGQPNEMGGVKWASSPHVGMEGHWSTTLMQNAPTHQEVPTPIMEGWHYTLQSSQTKMTEHEVMLLKRKRGDTYRPLRNTPLLTTITDSWYTYFELIVTVLLIVTVVHTRKLLWL